MEAVIFCGVQASGKSTFYIKKFFSTHVRISMDLLNTRNKERMFLHACLNTQQPFVVDNTNPTKQDRAKYIEWSKSKKYKIVGYYFSSDVEDALARNAARIGKEKIPIAGLRGTFKKIEVPVFEEGFDELNMVRIENGSFVVSIIDR